MDRMTDERLADLERNFENVSATPPICHELIQALKAERELTKHMFRSDTPCPSCAGYIDRITELEAKINRLTSRGFEDLHHENEQLKAKLERVQNAADELAEALADD